MSGPFFIKSKCRPFDSSRCDDCGRNILTVDPENHYWNPKPRARIRNICRECYEFRDHKKIERWNKRMAELDEFRTTAEKEAK